MARERERGREGAGEHNLRPILLLWESNTTLDG